MKRIIIETWKEYSLDLTLYPSYVLSLLVREDSSYVKIGGVSKGAIIKQINHCVEVIGEIDEEYAYELTGALTTPWDFLHKSPRNGRAIVEALIEMYPGVGLATGSRDYHFIFISIILSRRTNYHVNVLKWTRNLFPLIKSLEDLEVIDIRTISSYQFRQLRSLVRMFRYIDPLIKSNIDPERIRRSLLSIKGVGPKTADAFLLHGLRITEYAPIDVHFKSLAKKLGIGALEPQKSYCLRYSCSQCPLRSKCILANAKKLLGSALGYVQTIAYIHDKKYCKLHRCNLCSLRSLCIAI